MYTIPIDSITFADIESFVGEQNKESIILDYKRDWPTDLEKVMAAMANTQGGIILLGVAEEDKTGLPKDILGIDLEGGEDKLRQMVVSKAYQGIYPPLMPEIAVCPLEQDPDRAVVVIRVAPSTQTPHAVDQRRKIYVRVDSQTIPHNNLASIPELDWLWNRRRQAEEGRDILIQAAQERATWVLQHCLDTTELPLLRVWIAPHLHSGTDPLSLNTVKQFIEGHRSKSDILRGRWTFPSAAVNTARSIPSGFCAYSSMKQKQCEYDELGTSGLLYSETMEDMTESQTSLKRLHIYKILSHLDAMLKFADQAYDQGQLFGLIQIHASLHNVQGATIYVHDQIRPEELERLRAPNKNVNILNEVLNRQEIEKTRVRLIKQAARSILWSFGFSWDEGTFETWYRQKVLL